MLLESWGSSFLSIPPWLASSLFTFFKKTWTAQTGSISAASASSCCLERWTAVIEGNNSGFQSPIRGTHPWNISFGCAEQSRCVPCMEPGVPQGSKYQAQTPHPAEGNGRTSTAFTVFHLGSFFVLNHYQIISISFIPSLQVQQLVALRCQGKPIYRFNCFS